MKQHKKVVALMLAVLVLAAACLGDAVTRQIPAMIAKWIQLHRHRQEHRVVSKRQPWQQKREISMRNFQMTLRLLLW